jgi:uncharacterized protein YceK
MRTLLIALFWALFVLVVGCSEVRTLDDAGADAGGPPSCGPYVNVIGVAAFGSDWQSWSCSVDVPSSAGLDACRRRVQALEAEGLATCDAVRVEVEGCR